MDVSLFSSLKNSLGSSSQTFLTDCHELSGEVEQDISGVVDVCNLSA
jgi:hypothetical protein